MYRGHYFGLSVPRDGYNIGVGEDHQRWGWEEMRIGRVRWETRAGIQEVNSAGDELPAVQARMRGARVVVVYCFWVGSALVAAEERAVKGNGVARTERWILEVCQATEHDLETWEHGDWSAIGGA